MVCVGGDGGDGGSGGDHVFKVDAGGGGTPAHLALCCHLSQERHLYLVQKTDSIHYPTNCDPSPTKWCRVV